MRLLQTNGNAKSTCMDMRITKTAPAIPRPQTPKTDGCYVLFSFTYIVFERCYAFWLAFLSCPTLKSALYTPPCFLPVQGALEQHFLMGMCCIKD